MASEVDQQIERAREVMARIATSQDGGGDRARRRPRRRGDTPAARFATIVLANIAVLIAAAIAGSIFHLGLIGGLVVLGIMVAATLLIALSPGERVPAGDTLRQVDLKVLPAQTERWLAAQRGAMPAAARSVADRIGSRLDALSPQLGRVEGDTEAAFELRRLIGEQLPAFVADYARVPETLRAVERNGRTPDGELVAGLSLIEREIADMTERLAQTDLDSLQTRGRYLEMRYRDETSGGGGSDGAVGG